jgi:DNA-binding CsgD family transcriptional regulator
MTAWSKRFGGRGGRPAFLAVFLLLQTFAAVFFCGDALADLLDNPTSSHVWFEGLVALALVSGVLFGAMEMRRSLDRQRQQDTAIATATGELGKVINRQFTDWRLTPAERDVAHLALKGFDVAEIAEMRKAAAGTVRAQLSSIYAKAGVSGRAQFAAFFVEDLLADGLGSNAAV